jgi:GrpB-like predicted nucleotidyltransferase (UPF0157 family)
MKPITAPEERYARIMVEDDAKDLIAERIQDGLFRRWLRATPEEMKELRDLSYAVNLVFRECRIILNEVNDLEEKNEREK